MQDLDIETVKGDVLDRESLRELIKNADVVFHLDAVISINGFDKILFIKLMLKEQENVRLIHFSSIHALVQYSLNKPHTKTSTLAGKDAYIYPELFMKNYIFSIN